MGESYATAGVSLAAADDVVARIAGRAAIATRAEVVGGIGGFAGLFALDPGRWRAPLLVATTDGVGTKAAVAAAASRYDTVGLDLVAMCVDDLVCTGAEPLFLLDYVAVGQLDPPAVEALVGGVAEGCRRAGCALLGGEVAEHPGTMEPGTFDLAGFAVGVVEADARLPRDVATGDVVIGLPSPGLRSNGYSLARRVLLERAGLALDEPAWPGAEASLADVLLEPSVIYAPAALALLAAAPVHALAHVTGGGLAANLARVLPDRLGATVRRGTWEVPRVFAEVQRLGEVADDEMERVFNLGLGMVAVVPPAAVGEAVEVLRGSGHEAVVVGSVTEGPGGVVLADG